MRRLFLWCTVLYLRFWAHVALFFHRPKIIGIAGSVGKSSAREILYSALGENVSVKNIFGNSETGIPLGLLGIKPGGYDALSWIFMLIRAPFGIGYLKNTDWAIVEMGIDEPYPPRNMEFLLSIVKPEIAISLNVSATHTLQFQALFNEERYKDVKEDARHEFLIEKIAEDDCGIITKSGCRVGIYNRDNKYVDHEIEKFSRSKGETKLLSFGEKGGLSYTGYKVSTQGTEYSYLYKKEKISLNISDYALPLEYRETIGACLLAASEVGVDVKKAAVSIEKNFALPPGRSSMLKGVRDTLIVDSSYNASSVAVIAFLKMMVALKRETGRKVVFLFGDMRELGEEAEGEHELVSREIMKVVDYLYLVGPLTQKFVLPSLEKSNIPVMWFESAVAAGEYLNKNVPARALLLVKGSQNTIFLEEAVKELLESRDDIKKLCRQDPYWMDIKERYV